VFQTVITALLLGGVSLAWTVSERVSRLEVQLAEQTKAYERDRGKSDAEQEQMRKNMDAVREQLTEISARLALMLPRVP
jgi:hypothetical protein